MPHGFTTIMLPVSKTIAKEDFKECLHLLKQDLVSPVYILTISLEKEMALDEGLRAVAAYG